MDGEPMPEVETDHFDRILDYTRARGGATIPAVDTNGNAFSAPPDPFLDQTTKPSADPTGANTGATRT